MPPVPRLKPDEGWWSSTSRRRIGVLKVIVRLSEHRCADKDGHRRSAVVRVIVRNGQRGCAEDEQAQKKNKPLR